jgi:hypothetical protein
MPNRSSKKGNPNQKKNKLASTRGKGKVYSVPAAQSRIMRTDVPSVSSSGFGSDGRIRIKHREFIADVVGSTAFSLISYPINPGMAVTFPWLSGLCGRYENYRFNSLAFEYETQESSATAGTVMLAAEYDVDEASVPATKQELMANHNSVRSAVWAECIFTHDKKDLHKFQQYTLRNAALAANKDIKLFDVANMFVATKGSPNTTDIGELYVVYDVELITPQLEPLAAPAPAPFTSAKITSGGAVDNANPLGDASIPIGNIPLLTNDSNDLTFGTAGTYLAVLSVNGTTLLNSGPFSGTVTPLAAGNGISGPADTLDAWYLFTAAAGDVLHLTVSGAVVSSSYIYIVPFNVAYV